MSDEELLIEQTKEWMYMQVMVSGRVIDEATVRDFQAGWNVRHKARNDAGWKADAL